MRDPALGQIARGRQNVGPVGGLDHEEPRVGISRRRLVELHSVGRALGNDDVVPHLEAERAED